MSSPFVLKSKRLLKRASRPHSYVLTTQILTHMSLTRVIYVPVEGSVVPSSASSSPSPEAFLTSTNTNEQSLQKQQQQNGNHASSLSPTATTTTRDNELPRTTFYAPVSSSVLFSPMPSNNSFSMNSTPRRGVGAGMMITPQNDTEKMNQNPPLSARSVRTVSFFLSSLSLSLSLSHTHTHTHTRAL